jgi:c-di-GMP-binding flagellar brake protein YcgR
VQKLPRMGDSSTEILRDAIARNCAVVVSLPSAGMLRHHKSRFLTQTDQAFWVEAPAQERAIVDDLIRTDTPVGISFRLGEKKCAFTAPILERNAQFQINATTIVEAMLLRLPEKIHAIQRRNNYRVRVLKDSELRARVWRIPEHFHLRDRPTSALELSVQLRDVSTGGLGLLLLPKDNQPPKVLPDERLRVELRFREEDPLILEGRMRYAGGLRSADDSSPVRGGVQFKKLEDNLEGRQTLAMLTKIVGELQREEVRRARLGLREAS